MANRDYTGVQTIQIAPYDHEIKVEGNVVSTEFAGGIKYTAEGLSEYDEKRY